MSGLVKREVIVFANGVIQWSPLGKKGRLETALSTAQSVEEVRQNLLPER